MHRAIGREAGRVVRPRRPVGGRYSPPSTRRYESNLNLPQLDRKWRAIWATNKSGQGSDSQAEAHSKDALPKKYVLPMFPYPSGDLHLGHLRVYTISDVLSRFHRMQGFDVMHPIGWDAFGLPAENAAIERGIDPASWTKHNIQKMKSQLEAMNGQWDWDREFATCDPTFYKHTQQLFLLLHEAGLAYQAESLVNYDPVDKTVLANEQVDANGNSWRSGAKVEKRMLKQWFLKISEFRQELLDGLSELEKDGAWPERVLAMQRNWLGKSTGAKVKFPVVTYDHQTHADIEVFTTRPDTICGVQYVALASNHSAVQNLVKTDAHLQAFLDTLPSLAQDSKVGYLLPHLRVLNPLATEKAMPDATKASLPVYVAPYVLGDYGDGAVMGVPGHDSRDHAFWKYNRKDDPVRIVISSATEGLTKSPEIVPFVHQGRLTKDTGPLAGLTSAKAMRKVTELLESKDLGSGAETWRLRDWLISRQRYWGTPIPIIHCDSCGPQPVPNDQLPVELPPLLSHWAEGKTSNPLEHANDWINTKCPKCEGPAKRDTDTMDTFVDSSWYFMRFPDPHNTEAPFSAQAANANLPVDLYIGGVEHAILHLLYSRFISKFVATTSLWPEGSEFSGEPFKRVLTQGMVHGKTYSDPTTGRFLKPGEVDLTNSSKPLVVATNEVANVSFEKMSKSKYNGVDPGTCMARYGADATRAHILFQAPVSEVLEWDEEKIAGITRWLRRLHDFIANMEVKSKDSASIYMQVLYNAKLYFLKPPPDDLEPIDYGNGQIGFELSPELLSTPRQVQVMAHALKHREPQKGKADMLSVWAAAFERDKKLWRSVQGTIASVTDSYSKTHSLNTVVSDLMALTNTIIEYQSMNKDLAGDDVYRPDQRLTHVAIKALVQMMAPITPAFAEECWQIMSPPRRGIGQRITEEMYKSYIMWRYPQHSETVVPWPEPWGSVFDEPFPETDGTYEMLAPAAERCAVQINGKLRCVVDIVMPSADLKGKDLEKWMVDGILKTPEGRSKLMGKTDIRKAKKIIVVRGGKTINLVM